VQDFQKEHAAITIALQNRVLSLSIWTTRTSTLSPTSWCGYCHSDRNFQRRFGHVWM